MWLSVSGLVRPTSSTFRDDEAVDLVALDRELPECQGRAIDLDDGQRMILGNMLEGELLPGGGIVLLFGVVEALAAGPVTT